MTYENDKTEPCLKAEWFRPVMLARKLLNYTRPMSETMMSYNSRMPWRELYIMQK